MKERSIIVAYLRVVISVEDIYKNKLYILQLYLLEFRVSTKKRGT